MSLLFNQIANDLASRVVSFQYDVNNDVVQATDPVEGVTVFVYDANHRVTSATYVEESKGTSEPQVFTEEQ